MKKDKTVDFHIKAGWLAISRMYNAQAMSHEMTMAIGYVLLNIDLEKGTPATKIAPLLGLEPRSLTRMLKTLEEKGWIYRQSNEKDKRYVRIHLTSEGRIKREIAREKVIDFNKEVTRSIPAEKLTVFFEVVQEINRIAESLNTGEKNKLKENSEV